MVYGRIFYIYTGGGTRYAVYIHARGCPHIAWRAEKRVGGDRVSSYDLTPPTSIYLYLRMGKLEKTQNHKYPKKRSQKILWHR